MIDLTYRKTRVWVGVTQTLTIDLLDDQRRSEVLEVTARPGKQFFTLLLLS